jgi:CheY-like chemotaxis protein
MEIIPSPTPQPRILIFDHSQDVADVLAMRFVHHGCETKRLDTLENLSAEALSFGPDLILLDVEMHGASGFRAARRLRREPRLFDTWLVALGGRGRLQDIETAENAGFDESLSKPLTQDALQELLSEARSDCKRRVAYPLTVSERSPHGALPLEMQRR